MGRQIEFYLTSNDEQSLLAEINQVSELYIRPQHSQSKNEKLRLPLHPTNSADPLSLRRLLLASLPLSPKVILKHLKHNSDWIGDFTDSDVIQYHRCVLMAPSDPFAVYPWIERGRLWFSPRDSKGHPKRLEFVNWADKVLKLVRRHCYRLDRWCYAGKDAVNRAKNGELAFGRAHFTKEGHAQLMRTLKSIEL